jgi:hypothetical protein
VFHESAADMLLGNGPGRGHRNVRQRNQHVSTTRQYTELDYSYVKLNTSISRNSVRISVCASYRNDMWTVDNGNHIVTYTRGGVTNNSTRVRVGYRIYSLWRL